MLQLRIKATIIREGGYTLFIYTDELGWGVS